MKKSLAFLTAVTLSCSMFLNATGTSTILDDVYAYKVLDINFDNNENKNIISNKVYSASNKNGKYVSTLKGNGYEANNSKISVPISDLKLKETDTLITVSFLFKYDKNDTRVMPISFTTKNNNIYDLWIADGFFGFNTGNKDLYGIDNPFTDSNKFYSVVAEFNFDDITKSKLYIDGVAKTLSYKLQGTSYLAPLDNTYSDITIAGLKRDDVYNLKNKSIIDEVKVFNKSLTSQQISAVSDSYKAPILYTDVVNNSSVNLNWSTEILPENTVWTMGYEKDEQSAINLVYNASNGLGEGGQKISSESYTGSYSLYTPVTRPDKGNWVLYPYTKPSYQNHVYYTGTKVFFNNDDYISISYKLKSDYDVMVGILGNWQYEKKLNYHNSYLTKAGKKGDTKIYVSDTKWYDEYKKSENLSGVIISFDTEDSNIVVTNHYTIVAVDTVNNTIELNVGLRNDVANGLQIRTRKSVWMFNESYKTIKCNGEWVPVNFNTKLNISPYINWSEYPMDLRQGWATYGDAYIDDLKVGYATKVRLYRDGTKIYEGYESEFKDTTVVDKAIPSNVSNIKANVTKNETTYNGVIDITYSSAKDNGTTYKYSISSVNKSGKESPVSESKSATLTSGIKGYSYVIDKTATTTPDNTVDTTSTSIKYNIPDKNPSGTYYLHIKAIDNAGNVGATVHYKIDIPTLTVTPTPNKDMINLKWAMSDTSEKTFKIYQKKPGNNSFQSISMTNFDNLDKINVLNIYPSVSSTAKITFTTWDGETMTLPKAASLKKWMEEPNKEHSKGYGKGVIEVTPVSNEEFNLNPESYLKNVDGSWKYDVIMFGSWDDGKGKAITTESYNLIDSFIKSGRGVLFGHDTLHPGLSLVSIWGFRTYLNIEKAPKYVSGDGTTHQSVGGTTIMVNKKGLLTEYPWVIDKNELTIPRTHSGSQITNADIWMEFTNIDSGIAYGDTKNDLYVDSNGYTNNHYLITKNNVAMIQTGHSNGEATTDEQKVLANTLFYLNQLSETSFLDDYSGKDLAVPNKPNVSILSSTSSQLKFGFDNAKDNGSEYSYYVVSEDKNGTSKTQSNIVTTTITSGLKGYSYVLDDKPSTIPNDTVNHTGGDLTINNVSSNKVYYLHIKAIDNAGNVSEVLHYKVNTSKPLSPVINLSRTGWGTDDVTFNITQQHNKNFNIVSIGNFTQDNYLSKLKSYGYKITEKKGYTNVEELLKYDLVIVDAYCWGVHNENTLNQLYERGAKIITIGNDTTNTIYPITSTANVPGYTDLTINRVVKNEATFNLPTLGEGIESGSQTITGVVENTKVLYRDKVYNNPSIIEVTNANGGRWIHSQKVLGWGDKQDAKELVMGLVDYIMDYISQVHVKDVEYKINNGEWISYNGGDITISQEGLHTISVRNVDNRHVYSDVAIKTVGIDKSAPYLTATAPFKTTSRKISVALSGIGDTYSGVKNVRISNYSDFRDAVNLSVSGLTSTTVEITIPFFADVKENYSTRTIYIELFDNVGNSKLFTCKTEYEALPPKVPTILTPKEDKLYAKGSVVDINWNYSDLNNDGVKLTQSKAILTLTNTINKKVYKYTVLGSSTSYLTSTLDEGVYTLTIEVFNSLGKSAISSPVTFRYSYYKTKGYVYSKDILPVTPVGYVNVVSLSNIPKNTTIEGYLYYTENKDDAFDESKKVKFILSDVLDTSNTIKLPQKAEKLKVNFNLSNENEKQSIAPNIDNVIVYAK